MNQKVPRESWRVIEIVIRRYPDNIKTYDSEVKSMVVHSVADDGMPKGSGTGDPTFRAAVKLTESPRLSRINKEIRAVRDSFDMLPEQYKTIIVARYWSNRYHNRPYLEIEHITGYAEAQMKRVCGAFVRSVGEKLGEL
ncbi:MAG: hypothetical protein KBS66_05645 [Eubacterium sp.]|nr:hypothetical protein [Candidatus Colimonas fimequi]